MGFSWVLGAYLVVGSAKVNEYEVPPFLLRVVSKKIEYFVAAYCSGVLRGGSRVSGIPGHRGGRGRGHFGDTGAFSLIKEKAGKAPGPVWSEYVLMPTTWDRAEVMHLLLVI